MTERDAFEQFVDEFDKAVEPTNEQEPEPEVPAAAAAAEEEAPKPEAPPPVEPPVEDTPSAPVASPDLAAEISRLREELARLREPPVKEQQPPESYDAVKEKAYSELEEMYRPGDEEMESFLSDPGPTLAKMASRLHVRIIENVAQLVRHHMAQIPQLLEATEQRARAEQGFWEKFDARWPDLAREDPKYREKVAAFGQSYRQFNPKVTEQEFIDKVGAQVSLMLGLVPAAPAKAAPTKPPAKGGKPGPSQSKPLNPWEELYRDFEADDSF